MISKKAGFNYHRLNVEQSNQYFASGIPTVKEKHELKNTEIKKNLQALLKFFGYTHQIFCISLVTPAAANSL